MGRRSWVRAVPVAVVLVLGACSGGSGGAGPRTSASDPVTTGSTSSGSSLPSTTKPAAPRYLKARPDPSLPRQDIDVKVSYPSSFTKAQVAVVQAWTNYRHVFYATLDPPDPNSRLFSRVTTAEGVAAGRSQRLELQNKGLAARVPSDGSLREQVVSVHITANSAALTTCQVDSAVQFRRNTSVVVNRTVSTRRVVAQLEMRSGGQWLVGKGGSETQHWTGDLQDRCLAA